MHKVAIIGSGNIGTDRMIKVVRKSRLLEMGVLVGVDPSSEGLARARRMGVPITDQGIEGLLKMKDFDEIRVVFDATSAKAHLKSRSNSLFRRAARIHRSTNSTPASTFALSSVSNYRAY